MRIITPGEKTEMSRVAQKGPSEIKKKRKMERINVLLGHLGRVPPLPGS